MSAVVTTQNAVDPRASGAFAIVSWPAERAIIAPEILHLRLVTDEDEEEELDLSTIVREFPTVMVERATACRPGDLVIDDFAWRGAFDFRRFDEAIEQSRPTGIAVRGSDAAGVACEVMARYQRLIARRNGASETPLFDAVLEAHASLFNPELPVESGPVDVRGARAHAAARPDLEHALDTWQWILRLDPEAGLAPQLAALFHDIDRLESDPHERIEHRARRTADDRQAKACGERAMAILRGVGVAEEEAARVCDLIGGQAQGEHDAALLDDADGLSFLSLMSHRYADYFGLAQTRRKVTFTLGRLGPVAREKVALFRLRPDVHRLLQPA